MYNFTDKKSDVWNVEIDLRYEADGLIKEFGIDALYIRNCKFVRCRCFDDLNKTGDPKCKLCFGTGHFASIEKIQCIESSSSAYSSTNSLLQTNIGITDQKNEVYYIRHNRTPKIRDMILKITWDKDGNPVDIKQVLEITNIYEMRGTNGRVELDGCLINDRTDLVVPYQDILKKLPKKAVSELLKGGKYIWPANLLGN